MRIRCFWGLLAASTAFGRPAQWISGDTMDPACAAPVLERSFVMDSLPGSAALELSVAGWCEVRVNGRTVGDEVLYPVACQPNRRIPRVSFDVRPYLQTGTNVLSVLLGNGWFNCFTRCTWKFHEADWIAAPQIRGELVADGKPVLITDETWTARDSPIVFDSLRNGEWYDARREGARILVRPAKVELFSPRGCESKAVAEPCRAFETFNPVRVLKDPDGDAVYDFGANLAGWCEIEVKGTAGAKVTLDYDESLTPSNTLLRHVIGHIVRNGDPRPAQHDEYTLRGASDGERWHPRFTYHGFRYVRVRQTGEVTVRAIRARFVHSAFDRAGTVDIPNPTFAALQSATERSYLSNFVGIPTDCPHREKNGWTGDAQLAMETGLWNFDARKGYEHFLEMAIDAQLPNGAIPCVLPCAPGFGYGWGSGPGWDAVLFEIPYELHRFYGDDSAARRVWPAMKRYLAYMGSKADADGLFKYGLPDWCTPLGSKVSDLRLTDSAYVYGFYRHAAAWAGRFGEHAFAESCRARAETIRAAFNRVFYRGNGLYGSGLQTELAAPLYFKGLCASGEERKVVDRLVTAVRAKGHRADFGIFGAKWVPRVLADHGLIDDAYRLFVQPEVPGWAHWMSFGDGTLREDFTDRWSHNHIMFGDLSAWAYEYLGGIKIVEPGFRKIAVRPQFPRDLGSFSARHTTKYGEIRVSWRRVNGKPVVERSIPAGIECVEDGQDGKGDAK